MARKKSEEIKMESAEKQNTAATQESKTTSAKTTAKTSKKSKTAKAEKSDKDYCEGCVTHRVLVTKFDYPSDEGYEEVDEDNEDSFIDYRLVYDSEVILQRVRNGYCVYILRNGNSRVCRPKEGYDYSSYRFGGIFMDLDEAEDFFFEVCERIEYR